MFVKQLAFLAPLLLAACSQPKKQAAPVTSDATSIAKAEPAPAPEPVPSQSTNLYEVVAIARACAEQRPGGLVGRAGTAVVLDKYFVIEPTEAGAWKVTFTEQKPSARPYGRSFEVDATKGLCDGIALASPASASGHSKAEAVMEAARKCAQEKPFDGNGACGSPLLLDQPTIHYQSESSWVVSFPEESAKCIPRGRDLVVSADASECGAAPMD